MQLQAQLVHAGASSRIVQVSAWLGGRFLGSALGEAPSAEEAEERALGRLQQRLGEAGSSPPRIDSPAAPIQRSPEPVQRLGAPEPALEPAAEPAPEPAAEPASEPAADPEDWSDELAKLDLELQRLGWGRDQEAAYLERAFGHPSRGRLTRYGDLLAYLDTLRRAMPGAEPTALPVPLRRRDLLEQCDQLLRLLQWDASRGRAFLEQQFSLSSRQQLSDEQLLHFNLMLEGEIPAETPTTP